MATVTIEVTQDDIDHGQREMCCECPVALAMRRVLAGTCYPVVYGGGANICRRKNGAIITALALPRNVVSFVEAFDCKKPVKPIAFDINISDDLIAARS